MLICDILSVYHIRKTLMLASLGSLVYVMDCSYYIIFILMKAKTIPQLSQVVDLLPLATQFFAVPTYDL